MRWLFAGVLALGGAACSDGISPSSPKYHVEFLGDGSYGVAINDSGDVVGLSNGVAGVMWRNGSIVSLGSCRPRDVNDFRQVACSPLDSYGVGHVWHEGALTPVEIPNSQIQLTAINDSGAVGGYGRGDETRPLFAFVIRGADTTWHYQSRHFVEATYGMNNFDVLLGRQYRSSSSYPFAVAFTRTGLVELGWRTADVYGISDSGVVVGSESCFIYGAPRPHAWSLTDSTQRFLSNECTGGKDAPGVLTADAYAVNNAGDIVGYEWRTTNRAYLWRDGRTFDLTAAVPREWLVTAANGINDVGEILARVTNNKTGEKGAAILRPR